MRNKIESIRTQLAKKHSFTKELIFTIKTNYLTLRRKMNNGNAKTFPLEKNITDFHILSQSVSQLWNKNDNKENWIMTAGKIQNLRIAAAKINGTIIPAGEIFSFWKYVGKPTKNNGFVVGREIREGCIVPSIAGGLCQLSNALYDAAIKAGFTINERHRHSQIVKGSLAEQNRDATVKWNYVDLRFSSDTDFQIIIEMNDENLIVTHKGNKKITEFKNFTYLPNLKASPLNDCLSCRNTDCYICNTNSNVFNEQSITYVLDEKWAEYEDYINSKIREQDFVLQPFSQFWCRLLKRDNNYWNIHSRSILYFSNLAIKRIKNFHLNKPKNIFSWQIEVDEDLAKRLISRIPVESTHLVVSQNFLPFLQKYYAFAGRTYEVLMTRSSVDNIQTTLDAVYEKYPESQTLSDFRASIEFLKLENKALTSADRLITPHLKISQSFSNVLLLDWKYPSVTNFTTAKKNKILFAGSPLGRKGAYELRQLIKDLNIPITIVGKTLESPNFFDGLNVSFLASQSLQDVALVIYPAYIENRPKLILKAIASGIPVVISDACGITPDEQVYVFPTGDYMLMKNQVEQVLNSINSANRKIIC